MSNIPNSCACPIATTMTWNPCPFKINNCLFVKGIPLGINFFYKKTIISKANQVIHVFVIGLHHYI